MTDSDGDAEGNGGIAVRVMRMGPIMRMVEVQVARRVVVSS